MRLSPHEYWITQEQGTERPFTGDYWWLNDVGRYDCKVCSQRLFMYDHKYQDKSGYASFWNTVPNSINMRTDHLEVPHFTNAHVDPIFRYKQPIKRATCSHVSKARSATFVLNFWFLLSAIPTLAMSITMDQHHMVSVSKSTQQLYTSLKSLGLIYLPYPKM